MDLHEYSIARCEIHVLSELEKNKTQHTVFLTEAWVNFLKKNQNGEPVVLSISEDGEILAYFVGMVVSKMGLRILGSPFEGWLTCDMGFIRIKDFDINAALMGVSKYAFRTLNCWYVQIYDKEIKESELDKSIKRFSKPMLLLDISRSQDEILQSFTKPAKRYIRQSSQRLTFREVSFDKEFIDIYYEQLKGIFERQRLLPTFNKEKLYDLADALKDNSYLVFAEEAFAADGECIGTSLTFGFGKWSYYLCAANSRAQQNCHPGEGLFWELVKHWNEQKIEMMDLVGVRDYKLRYSPSVDNEIYVYFERIPGIYAMKNIAAKVVSGIRSIKGKFAVKIMEEDNNEQSSEAGSNSADGNN